MNILLEKALWYAGNGWYVFPTRETESKPFIRNDKEIKIPAKAPYISGGFKSSSVEEKQIKEWWDKFPNAGIGIDCGKSNLVCVDIDVRKTDGFTNFMKLKISDEGALHSITPSGGMHIIYKGLLKSHANVKAGVDIRSEGAYFLAPPSWIIEEGEKKSYSSVGEWNDLSTINVPPSLEEKLTRLKGKTRHNKTIVDEELSVTIEKVRKALSILPSTFYDDYFSWVEIGLALKTLGEYGFELWDSWSRQSSKYDKDELRYRWERFEPREIGIGSIFYYAKNYGNKK